MKILGKNKEKIILVVCVSLALLLIFFVYLKLTLQDKYFPYWDAYNIKLVSETIGGKEYLPVTWDPLFYYNTKIFHQITNLDYYYIIKYGKFFFIFLLFFVLYLLFKEIIRSEKKNEKALILISLIYFFFCRYTYLRFSMTLRENLVISLGFIFLFLLTKFEQKDKLSYSNVILLSLIYSYIIAAHMAVSFIITGVVGFYFLNCLIKKGNIKPILLLIVLTGIISSFFIYHQYAGIVAQLHHGKEFIEEAGFTVAREYIKSSYFNIPMDILIAVIGLLFFIKKLASKREKFGRYKIFLFYLLVISSFFLAAFIHQFGIRQNRFAIYIYVIFAFFLLFFLKKIMTIKYNKIILPLILVLLFITMIPRVLSYPGLRPINERNINFIENLVKERKLSLNEKIYCGPSACCALNYLYPASYKNREPINKENLADLRPYINQIVVFDDDWYAYERIDKKFLDFIKTNKNKIFIDPELLRRFKVWGY